MLFSKLYIDFNVIDHLVTKRIYSKLKIPFEIVKDQSSFLKKIGGTNNSITLGKKSLYLTENKGNFIKKCPGTRYYTCCDYSILHIGSFCFMDCSYCILQAYFHPPIMQFFVNYSKLETELDSVFTKNNICRVGTGEFTDSLIWEELTGISKLLIEKFSNQNRAVLELKTKTVNIDNFEKLNHNRKTILSWSLNTPLVIQTEEKRTSTLGARLRAAAKCEAWGYPLAFHFDPIIIYEGCKKDYKKVVETLFRSISPKNIVWISIGTFRFIPSLKPIIKKRFPLSKIIYGEFINGIDGKMRYFKSLRIKLYKYIVKTIRDISPDTCIYFCMEDDQIWKEVMGYTFSDDWHLAKFLDDEAIKKCDLYRPVQPPISSNKFREVQK